MALVSSSMHAPATVGGQGPHGRPARWAVGAGVVSSAVFAVAVATVGIAYGIGAASTVEDSLLGLALAGAAMLGLLGSLGAFVAALVARVKRDHWALLWLPLCAFPALLLFVILGEALWWE